MTRRGTLVVGGALLVVGAALAGVFGGGAGLGGFGLGAVAAWISAMGTHWVTHLAALSAADERQAGRGSVAIVTLLMLKFPLFLLLAVLAYGLGTPGLIGFLGATALVYSATVGWALSKG